MREEEESIENVKRVRERVCEDGDGDGVNQKGGGTMQCFLRGNYSYDLDLYLLILFYLILFVYF